MANTNSPLFSLSAHGTVANQLTYQKSTAGTTVKRKQRAPASRTTAQLANRALHALLEDTFRAQPPAFTNWWTVALGRKRMTPATYFISKNLSVLQAATNLQGMTLAASSGILSLPTNVVVTSPQTLILVSTDSPTAPPSYSSPAMTAIAVSDQDPSTISLLSMTFGQDVSPPISFNFPQPSASSPFFVSVFLTAINPRGTMEISPAVNVPIA